MSKDPKWWTEEHESTWSRVKSALKRDWEQTKADFTTKSKRHDIDQGAGDTVKQAAGKEPIPPEGVPNAPSWDDVESSYRYGVGARHQFRDWNDQRLEDDWTQLKNGRNWEEVKPTVRRGWDEGGK